MKLRIRPTLFIIAILLFISNANAQIPSRVITADFTKAKGPHNKFFREVVGAGRAAEGLRTEWQRDLALVHRQCGSLIQPRTDCSAALEVAPCYFDVWTERHLVIFWAGVQAAYFPLYSVTA